MPNKESAISFLKMAGTGDVRAAYDKFVAPDFLHHNPYFPGDRQSLMTAMENAHRMVSNKAVDVKLALEEGDYVMTHSHVTRQDPSAPEVSVVHIFRFKNGRIAELWDVGMMLDKNSPNKNGPF